VHARLASARRAVVMMRVMMGAGDHAGQPNGDPSTGQRGGAPSARGGWLAVDRIGQRELHSHPLV